MRIVVHSSADLPIGIFLTALLLSLLELSGQAPVPQAHLPLFHAVQLELSNASDGRDFSISIPRHIQIEDGSEVQLTLRPLVGLRLPPLATTLAWNGRVLVTNPPPVDPASPLSFRAAVYVPTIRLGPNTVSLRWVSPSTNESTLPREPVGCTLRREECFLNLVYTRSIPDAALEHLPHSLAEEQLLHQQPDASSNAVVSPAFTILLPGLCGEIHLRATAIAVARLGQLEYLSSSYCQVAALESWKAESTQRPCLLIARRDQLGGVEVPASVSIALAALAPGRGLLAEFFEGLPPTQRRIVLVTGSDDRGLEKAALTLGSTPALASLKANPAVLDQTPSLDGVSIPGAAPAPALEGLYQLQELLKTDPFARQAAFAVPAGASLDSVREFLPLWWDLGRARPNASVLWPELVTYRPGVRPDPARLAGRNVLALGAVFQWPDLLPPAAEQPSLNMYSSEAGAVSMQGRRQKRAALEPTLSFVQMLPSPWSSSNVLVLVGGWKTYALPATRRLLLDPTSPGKLVGTLGAMDELGRAASYDLRHVTSESFAERLRRMIPPGVGLEESAGRAAAHQAGRERSRRWNQRLAMVCGTVLALLVGARVLLMWQQARAQQETLDGDGSSGGAS